MSKTKWFSVGTLALALLLCPLARATSLGWSYIASGSSGMGQLTATAIGKGQFLITSFTGTYNGLTIGALLPPGALEAGVGLQSGAICPANDNILFIRGPFLDCAGIAFNAGGLEVNLYYLGPTFLYATTNRDIATGNAVFGNSGGVFAVTPVPEPSTLALASLGLIVLAFFTLVLPRSQSR